MENDYYRRFRKGETVQVDAIERACIQDYLDSGGFEDIPESLAAVMKRAAEVLVREDGLTMKSIGHQLSIQGAADILNVPRHYMSRLLDEGAIPHTDFGVSRRVYLTDLLAYKKIRDAKRREGLRQMTREWEEIEYRNKCAKERKKDDDIKK